jgi:nucleoside-diphosphate-sugar epimerase
LCQTAQLRTVTWDQFRDGTDDEAADSSWNHLVRNHYFSIDKARTLIGYAPRYEPDEAVLESVRWLIDHGQLDVVNPLKV